MNAPSSHNSKTSQFESTSPAHAQAKESTPTNQPLAGFPSSSKEDTFKSTLKSRLKKASRNKTTCVAVTWLLGTLIAFLLTATQGVPAPVFQDEFGYLLAADTFASGRLTNPTHPMWHHFETYHVIHQPSYTAKYHPAQGLTLAVGQLLGHPIIGACLATGISCAALMWMLTAWLPRRYYWIAILFVICHPGIQLTWGQSYWGGAVALTGSSLLLGAFARLNQTFQIKYAVIAAFGTVLLANSRPFEGAVLTAVVGLALLWKLVQIESWQLKPFLARVILPGFIILGLGAGWMMTYNHAVTGNAFELPYKIHEDNYGWTPLFLWQTAGAKPSYRHPDMESGYVGDKESTESHFKSTFDVVTIKLGSTIRIMGFYCGGACLLLMFGLPWLLRNPRYKLAIYLAIPAFFAGMATPWEWAHYCAPAAPLLFLLLLASWIEFWRRTRQSPLLRFGIVIVILALQFSWTAKVYRKQEAIGQRSWPNQRMAFKEQLTKSAGRDLVLVRYSDTHDPREEWVYNDADIDASEIAWAREISPTAREDLISYFNDRNIWVLDADAQPAVLRPFNSHERSEVTQELSLRTQ